MLSGLKLLQKKNHSIRTRNKVWISFFFWQNLSSEIMALQYLPSLFMFFLLIIIYRHYWYYLLLKFRHCSVLQTLPHQFQSSIYPSISKWRGGKKQKSKKKNKKKKRIIGIHAPSNGAYIENKKINLGIIRRASDKKQ